MVLPFDYRQSRPLTPPPITEWFANQYYLVLLGKNLTIILMIKLWHSFSVHVSYVSIWYKYQNITYTDNFAKFTFLDEEIQFNNLFKRAVCALHIHEGPGELKSSLQSSCQDLYPGVGLLHARKKGQLKGNFSVMHCLLKLTNVPHFNQGRMTPWSLKSGRYDVPREVIKNFLCWAQSSFQIRTFGNRTRATAFEHDT